MKILGEGNLHRNDKSVIMPQRTLLLTGALQLPLMTEIFAQDDFLVESWPQAYLLGSELLFVSMCSFARARRLHMCSSAYNYSGMTVTSNHWQHRDMDLKSSSATLTDNSHFCSITLYFIVPSCWTSLDTSELTLAR